MTEKKIKYKYIQSQKGIKITERIENIEKNPSVARPFLFFTPVLHEEIRKREREGGGNSRKGEKMKKGKKGGKLN